eukprot:1374504-Amphidinium_carterae.1
MSACGGQFAELPRMSEGAQKRAAHRISTLPFTACFSHNRPQSYKSGDMDGVKANAKVLALCCNAFRKFRAVVLAAMLR